MSSLLEEESRTGDWLRTNIRQTSLPLRLDAAPPVAAGLPASRSSAKIDAQSVLSLSLSFSLSAQVTCSRALGPQFLVN